MLSHFEHLFLFLCCRSAVCAPWQSTLQLRSRTLQKRTHVQPLHPNSNGVCMVAVGTEEVGMEEDTMLAEGVTVTTAEGVTTAVVARATVEATAVVVTAMVAATTATEAGAAVQGATTQVATAALPTTTTTPLRLCTCRPPAIPPRTTTWLQRQTTAARVTASILRTVARANALA